MAALQAEASQKGKHHIVLKCPADLPANTFYQHIGLSLITVVNGSRRKLNVWSLALTTKDRVELLAIGSSQFGHNRPADES